MNRQHPSGGSRVIGDAGNARDLFGLRGTAGLSVRGGMLLRASAAGVAAVSATRRPGTVVDLRDPAERAARPLTGEYAATEHCPVSVSRAVLRGVPVPGPHRYLAYYRSMLPVAAPVAATVVDLLATPGSTPVLVCCTLGKDRTSVVCGLVLRALGVRLADVARDHALTGRLHRRSVVAGATPPWVGRPDERARTAGMATVAATMRELLLDVERGHGSVAGYLTRHGGLTSQSLERAVHTVLTGPGTAGGSEVRP
ncbi:tyrosine-protein phosphatase [Streptomyces sp. NPDC020192]|uniref:tyrosine-protein phosphatase n=1 Tax=Streptomyces sp. NPDC020192 TaxID=3365066 RepID=UPI0037A225CC